jgi:hypothetical protein
LPVAGVEVLIFDAFDEPAAESQMRIPGTGVNPVACLKTNAKGEFSFAARSGTYRLEFAPSPTTRFLKHVVKEITVTSNTSCVVNLNTGLLLSGRALRSDGKPLRGGDMVGLCIEPTLYLASSHLSLDGDYHLVVPKGTFQLAYRPRQPDFANGEVAGSQDIDPDELVPALAITEEVVSIDSDVHFDLVLPPLVEFNGEVVGGPNPVPDALVTVVPSEFSEIADEFDLVSMAQSKSDSLGKFKLYLQPGTYDISIDSPDGSHLFGLNQSRKNVVENCFERFVLPAGFSLTGQALCGERILSDCLVRVLALEQDREFLTKTDANGEFELKVPAGDYRVIVSAHPKDSPTKTINGIDYAGLAPLTSQIDVRRDTKIDFNLKEGTALYGRVLDESGAFRAGVPVSVYLDSDFGEAERNKRKALSSGSTDPQGNYCFFLSPGSYWLSVLNDFANAKQVSVGAEPACVDLTFKGWCQLRFEVQGEDGMKIARCRFKSSKYSVLGAQGENRTQDHLTDCSLLTGEDGACCVTLPQGIYTFEFEPPKGSSYAGKILRQLSVSTDLSRKVALAFKDSSQNQQD